MHWTATVQHCVQPVHTIANLSIRVHSQNRALHSTSLNITILEFQHFKMIILVESLRIKISDKISMLLKMPIIERVTNEYANMSQTQIMVQEM